MPNRISSVFKIDKSGDKGKIRYNTICEFNYSNEQLVESESIVLTTHAPCVADDEFLARVLESPTSVEIENGLKYTPGAFSDAQKWGLSVQRPVLTTADAINKFGSDRAKLKGRTYLGFVQALAENLRSEVSPNSKKRLLGIYATASEEDPSHADIYAVTNSKEDKESIKAAFWLHFKLDALMPKIMEQIST